MRETGENQPVAEPGKGSRRDFLKVAGALAGAATLTQFISTTTLAGP